jgi:hypothetical protein
MTELPELLRHALRTQMLLNRVHQATRDIGSRKSQDWLLQGPLIASFESELDQLEHESRKAVKGESLSMYSYSQRLTAIRRGLDLATVCSATSSDSVLPGATRGRESQNRLA